MVPARRAGARDPRQNAQKAPSVPANAVRGPRDPDPRKDHPMTAMSSCSLCSRDFECPDVTPLPWCCSECAEHVESAPVLTLQVHGQPCLFCTAPLVEYDDMFVCTRFCALFYAAEVACREWLIGRTDRGTPDFGERWPEVRREIEIELRGRFHTADPLADAERAAEIVAEFGSDGGR